MDTPVVIIGGGPVGLGIAAELGWRGVNCLLVEQTDGSIEHPKTQNINMRTMEFCRRWGIADKVRDLGFPKDYRQDVIHVTSLAGYELARQIYPAYSELRTPPGVLELNQRCSQTIFDPILRELASSFACVSLRYQTACSLVDQDESGVTVRLRNVQNDTDETLRAGYVVACEGAMSVTREALGIALEGTDVLSYSTNILFRSEDLLRCHDKGPGFYVLDGPEGRWATLNAINGRDLWRLQLRGSKDPKFWESLDEDACIQRMAGIDFDYEILSSLAWVRRQLVADHYQMGRVFLAGDSAHQLSPSGGFGMNTGFGDAVDLAWKLEGTLAGWGGRGLLDTYEVERRPIGRRNVDEATAKFTREGAKSAKPGPAIVEDSPEGAAVRKRVSAELQEAISRENVSSELGARFETAGIQLGYVYRSSPIIVSDDLSSEHDDPMHYKPSAQPGARAPHFWIDDTTSILDLFGRGFVLLRLGAHAPKGIELAAAARAVGLPLEVHKFDIDELTSLYEKKLVLVRPDGHVAWWGDSAPKSAIQLIDQIRGCIPE